MSVGQSLDFVSGGEFTVGIEEELLLVRPPRHGLSRCSDRLLDGVRRCDGSGGTVSGEVSMYEIEFGSSVCRDAHELDECIRAARRALQKAGGCAMAAGVHPKAPFGRFLPAQGPRYESVVQNLAGLLRT